MTAFKKNDTTVNEVAIGLVLAVLIVVIAIAWGGFWTGLTLSVLWGWFVVPLFALPALSIAHAYGIALVLRCAKGLMPSDSQKDRSFADSLGRMLIIPPCVAGLLMGVGWCVKTWF